VPGTRQVGLTSHLTELGNRQVKMKSLDVNCPPSGVYLPVSSSALISGSFYDLFVRLSLHTAFSRQKVVIVDEILSFFFNRQNKSTTVTSEYLQQSHSTNIMTNFTLGYAKYRLHSSHCMRVTLLRLAQWFSHRPAVTWTVCYQS